MARKDIVREYEAACEDAGAQAGIVDLTTFNVINAVLAGSQRPTDDWLLVHVTHEDATMAILRGDAPRVLPQPDRRWGSRARRHGTPDGDVLRRSSQRLLASAVSCSPGAARRQEKARRTPNTYAARSSSGWAPSRRRRSAERGDIPGPHLGEHRVARHAGAARRLAGAGARRPEMLRANLSTRPFYNERSVHGLLFIAALIVAGLTIFNVTQIVLLTRRQSALSGEAAAAEARATELRAHAARTRQAVNTKQLESISEAAREANTIIGQRLFSWTDLLNRLEKTLPDNVRITALRPSVDRDGTITVTMTVAAETVDDIEQFMANLEGTTAFSERQSARRRADGRRSACAPASKGNMQLSPRRVFDEKRRLVIPIARRAGAEHCGVRRNRVSAGRPCTEHRSRVPAAAAQQLQSAEREDADARGITEGRDRTDIGVEGLLQRRAAVESRAGTPGDVPPTDAARRAAQPRTCAARAPIPGRRGTRRWRACRSR